MDPATADEDIQRTEGMGEWPGVVKKLQASVLPHMGWNTCSHQHEHPLTEGLSNDDYFYFVHSYYAPVNDAALATCNYITDFAAITSWNNVMGTQFHPEKSGDAGQQILKNFLDISKT